jgi:hypothetical protein
MEVCAFCSQSRRSLCWSHWHSLGIVEIYMYGWGILWRVQPHEVRGNVMRVSNFRLLRWFIVLILHLSMFPTFQKFASSLYSYIEEAACASDTTAAHPPSNIRRSRCAVTFIEDVYGAQSLRNCGVTELYIKPSDVKMILRLQTCWNDGLGMFRRSQEFRMFSEKPKYRKAGRISSFKRDWFLFTHWLLIFQRLNSRVT